MESKIEKFVLGVIVALISTGGATFVIWGGWSILHDGMPQVPEASLWASFGVVLIARGISIAVWTRSEKVS